MKKHNMGDATKIIYGDFRGKGNDLTKPEDLKHALTLAVAAWRDYCHYSGTLSVLIESFDESVEHYDTASWFNMSLSPGKVDELTTEGMDALNTASVAFDKLSDRAKDQCVMILKKALDASPETQKVVLGKTYRGEQSELDARIEELFDALLEADYHHAIPENYDEFLLVMDEVWQDK